MLGLDCVADVLSDVDVEEMEPVGLWANFMKQVTSVKATKCKLEYLPAVGKLAKTFIAVILNKDLQQVIGPAMKVVYG